MSTYFHVAVHEICLARMLYFFAVVIPVLVQVFVSVTVSVEVVPNSTYTAMTIFQIRVYCLSYHVQRIQYLPSILYNKSKNLL